MSLLDTEDSFKSEVLQMTSTSVTSSESSTQAVGFVNKKIPIGSQPEFSIPDDSTIETPLQRGLLWAHFGLLAYNLYIFGISLRSTSILSLAGVKYVLLVAFSVILGDFATGVFHWSVDNYGSLKTPIFGSVCAAFQGHHSTPWTITFRSFYNNLYKVACGTIPALALLSLCDCKPEVRLFFSLFINWWLLSQEFHKWSHMRNPPEYARILQDKGIILSRKEHGLHHQDPFDAHYCILTGICNPILDRTNFFKRMELLVLSLTGNKPKNWKEAL